MRAVPVEFRERQYFAQDHVHRPCAVVLDDFLRLWAAHAGVCAEVGDVPLRVKQVVLVIKPHPGAAEWMVVALAQELYSPFLYRNEVVIRNSLNGLLEAREFFGPEAGRLVYDDPFRFSVPVPVVDAEHVAHEVARVRARKVGGATDGVIPLERLSPENESIATMSECLR